MVSFFKHKQGSLGLLQALEAQKKGSSKEDGQCGQGFQKLLCRYDRRTCQLEDRAVGLRNRAAFCWLNSVLLGKATAFSDKHTLAGAASIVSTPRLLGRESRVLSMGNERHHQLCPSRWPPLPVGVAPFGYCIPKPCPFWHGRPIHGGAYESPRR